MWNPDKVVAVATQVLVEYLGVSAQFLVEDAIAMCIRPGQLGADSEELQLSAFLIHLSERLPPDLPAHKIRDAILKKCRSS